MPHVAGFFRGLTQRLQCRLKVFARIHFCNNTFSRPILEIPAGTGYLQTPSHLATSCPHPMLQNSPVGIWQPQQVPQVWCEATSLAWGAILGRRAPLALTARQQKSSKALSREGWEFSVISSLRSLGTRAGNEVGITFLLFCRGLRKPGTAWRNGAGSAGSSTLTMLPLVRASAALLVQPEHGPAAFSRAQVTALQNEVPAPLSHLHQQLLPIAHLQTTSVKRHG